MKRTQIVGKSKGERKTKMKVYNTREAIHVAKRNGWFYVKSRGDHKYFKHPDSNKTLCISDNLNRIVWERCVREFNLDLNV